MEEHNALVFIRNLLESNWASIEELNSLSKQYGGVDLTKDKYLACLSALGLIESIVDECLDGYLKEE